MVAASETAGPGFRVVGRTAVRAALRSLARDGGRALLLTGGAGIGKSTLLDQLARQQRGRLVLSTTAIESEGELPFAALADLVRPLQDRIDELPPAQASALRSALAMADGPPPAPYAVCAATLGLLSAAGAERPLVLVDDLHWVDAPSKQVLLFVARRLSDEGVSMAMSVRPDGLAEIDATGIEVIELTALGPQESIELIRARAREMELFVAQQIARQAGGNPLALVETARSLTLEQRRGTEPLSGVVPASVTDALWGARLADLPDRAQRALLLVATARTSDLGAISRALRHQDLDEDDLTEAETAGLVTVSSHAAELRHPLVRSAVLHASTARQRQLANRTWSAVCADEERPWFLAAATHPPDDTVATALEDAARQALRRSAYGTASEAMVRAADFSTDEERKATLLARAAGWSLMGEAPHEAVAIGERALRHTDDPALRAKIELVLGRAVTWLGDVRAGHGRFTEAASTVQESDQVLAALLWAEAIVPAIMAGRLELANKDADRALAALPADAEPPVAVTACVVHARIVAGRATEAITLLDAGADALALADPVADLQSISLAGHVRTWAQQPITARALLDRAVAAARQHSAPLVLPYSLAVRSELDRWSGHWTTAYADGFEAVRWGRELAQRGSTGYALACVAYIDAARGDGARCRERLVELRRVSSQLDMASMDSYVAAVLGLCLLGENDIDAAVAQLELAHRHAGEQGVGTPTVVPYAGDLVEALFRAGRSGRALEIVDWLDAAAERTGLPWPAAVAARGRGLAAATPAEADAAFTAAYDALRRGPAPFDLARTRLCHGEVLRRLHRPTDARTHLESALDGFEALGAAPWAQRASSELAATGKRRAPNGAPIVALTPQEAQVATAVASGLSNPEVAAALFVSRKTVEAHLSRVYRKLGVRSRTELTIRLNDVTIR